MISNFVEYFNYLFIFLFCLHYYLVFYMILIGWLIKIVFVYIIKFCYEIEINNLKKSKYKVYKNEI